MPTPPRTAAMVHVINALLPLFLVIGLGAGLRAWGFLPEAFFAQLNRFCYWVAIPALLVCKLASAGFEGGAALRISWVLLAVMGMTLALAALLAALFRSPAPTRNAFIHAAFRGNYVFVGLPVILLTIGGWCHASAMAIEATAIVALAPLLAICNILGIVVLSVGRPRRPGQGTRSAAWHLVGQLLLNPLILACGVGLGLNGLALALPPAVDTTLQLVGQTAMPTALVALGASLSLRRLRGRVGLTALATVVKIGVAPVAGYGIARAAGLDPTETYIAMVYLACPTAVVTYVLAQQLDADEDLAGSVIVLSTLASAISLGTVVYLFRGG